MPRSASSASLWTGTRTSASSTRRWPPVRSDGTATSVPATASTRDTAGRRYALAVVEIARADGDADAWSTAVEGLASLTVEPRFVDALQADGMTDDAFVAIVRRVVPGATAKQLNLFRLLRRKGRLALGRSIASYFSELMDEERNVVRAVVTTAVELDAERQGAVRAKLQQQTGRTVELETRVDPAILGGMTVRVGDQLVDGSTRTRLRSLRSSLERAAL
ncbi:MAG: ATP synthase F1 subunit delta [Chloroflexi bacterium]|nr:ATP synthase F1 subunit delta [Chloroflexota bacterium]